MLCRVADILRYEVCKCNMRMTNRRIRSSVYLLFCIFATSHFSQLFHFSFILVYFIMKYNKLKTTYLSLKVTLWMFIFVLNLTCYEFYITLGLGFVKGMWHEMNYFLMKFSNECFISKQQEIIMQIDRCYVFEFFLESVLDLFLIGLKSFIICFLIGFFGLDFFCKI